MEQICATVRKARPEDAPRLLEIYSYYVEKTAVSFEYTTPSLSEFKTRMDNVMKNTHILSSKITEKYSGTHTQAHLQEERHTGGHAK